MKSDTQLVELIGDCCDLGQSFTEDELDSIADDLEREVPGLMKVVMSDENCSPEEALRLARHQRRVFVVGGDGGAQISHPNRPLVQDDDKA